MQPENDRVPQRIRLFLGSGSVSEGTKNTVFNTFLLFFLTRFSITREKHQATLARLAERGAGAADPE